MTRRHVVVCYRRVENDGKTMSTCHIDLSNIYKPMYFEKLKIRFSSMYSIILEIPVERNNR